MEHCWWTASRTWRGGWSPTRWTRPSGAVRIEKRLNKIDGVVASVNYATEKANATVLATISSVRLIETVQATGHTAAEAVPVTSTPSQGSDGSSASPASKLRHRLILSTLLSLPVIVLAMMPAWQFAYRQ